jgi:hypothetical protein
MKNTTSLALDGFSDTLTAPGHGVPSRLRSRFEGALAVARLDALFDGDWSFSVLERRDLTAGGTLVCGRLTVLGRISREAFGTSSLGLASALGDEGTEDDAYVDAATDALKRCATLLGVTIPFGTGSRDRIRLALEQLSLD